MHFELVTVHVQNINILQVHTIYFLFDSDLGKTKNKVLEQFSVLN